MNKIEYDKPQFIEGLTFRMNPGDVQKYIKAEEEIWFNDLASIPGFLGGETWVSKDNEGEVTSFYFWESEEVFRSIDPVFEAEHKKKSEEAVKTEFVRAWHEEDRRYRIREFRV